MKKSELYKIIKEELKKELEEQRRPRRPRRPGRLDRETRRKLDDIARKFKLDVGDLIRFSLSKDISLEKLVRLSDKELIDLLDDITPPTVTVDYDPITFYFCEQGGGYESVLINGNICSDGSINGPLYSEFEDGQGGYFFAVGANPNIPGCTQDTVSNFAEFINIVGSLATFLDSDNVNIDYDPSIGDPNGYTDEAAAQAGCQVAPPPDESYNCIDNVCTDPGDGTGTYTSLADCQTDGCESTSVDCIDNTCTVVQGNSGEFVDMAACEASGCEDTGPTPEACHDVTVVRCNPRGGTDQQNLSCITIDGQAVNLDEPATSQLRMGSVTLPSANSPGDTYEVPAIYQVVEAIPSQGIVTDYPFGNCKGPSPSDPFDKEFKPYEGPKEPYFQESKKLRKNLRDEFLLSEEQKLRKIIKHILKNKK